MVKDGPGTLTLTAATNNLTGTTLVNNGSLVGTVANLATPVTLANGANVTFYQATDATLTTPINGTGSLGKTGPGVLTLGALQQYSGVTTIGGGTLKLGAPAYQPALMHLAMDGAIGPINDGDPDPRCQRQRQQRNYARQRGKLCRRAFRPGYPVHYAGQYIQAPPINNGVAGAYTVSLWMDISSANNAQGYHSICSTPLGASLDGRHADRL